MNRHAAVRRDPHASGGSTNREELTEAVHDLADSPHMSRYALEHAMARLDLVQLGEVFDAVADHHTLTGGALYAVTRGDD